MVQEQRKVSVNKGAVQELACHGPQDRVETLFRETYRTLKRLDISAPNATKPLGKSPRYSGGQPSVHDVMAWLDGLRIPRPSDDGIVKKELNKDIKWLKSLHVTLRNRCHDPVVEEVESG